MDPKGIDLPTAHPMSTSPFADVRLFPPPLCRWLLSGVTEIGQPLNWALGVLNRADKRALGFAVLITDGAVDNERLICAPLLNPQTSPLGNSRILTFGIG